MSDNVLQEGDLIESHFAVERRNRTIYKKDAEYLYVLKHDERLRLLFSPVGDGAAVSYKMKTKGSKMRKPELLIPASSLEVLKTAVIFGADAVYIGGEAFGLESQSKNFSMEEMKEGIEFAHARGVKVYVTANILAHNYDLEGGRTIFQGIERDPSRCTDYCRSGCFSIAKQVCLEIERHISTQANNTNYETYRFWYELGAKRIVSARELSLEEIRQDSCKYSG